MVVATNHAISLLPCQPAEIRNQPGYTLAPATNCVACRVCVAYVDYSHYTTHWAAQASRAQSILHPYTGQAAPPGRPV